MSRHGSAMQAVTGHEESALGKVYDARLMRRLGTYVWPHRMLVLGSLLLVLTLAVVQLVQPVLIKWAIDDHIMAGQLDGLGWIATMFLIALVGEFVLRYAQLYVLEWTGQNVVYDLRTRVFSHLQSLSSSYFDRHPVGRLMTRVTSDVEALNEAFTSGVVMILADLIKLVGIVAILLWMDWQLSLVTFAIVPLMLGISFYFRARMRRAYRQVRRMVAKLNAYFQENVSGMRLIQLFGRERANRDEFDKLNREHRDAELDGVVYDSAFSAVAELMGSITLAGILWAGGWRILGGAITFGTLVAFIEYARRFFDPVQQLSQRYAVMQAAMASAERLFELLDTPSDIVSPAQPVAVVERPRGAIAFENVTFGYKPDEPVLRNVSFRIEPGESIGVVGWTGSGKSTLIRLLGRLYDVWDGRVTVDGVDVRDYRPEDLRRAIGIVLQEPFLFAGSVASNITLGDTRVTEVDMRRAAEAVGAARFIDELPNKYREEVRERGSNFSVGEKQLLTFARALAFDPAVLVLDEATSSVDAATERRIRAALVELLEGRTSIVIAHRLATIRDADRVLVLHRGELAEQGSHDDLMQISNGIYRKLYSLQTFAAS